MRRMTEITANWLQLHSLSLHPPPQKKTPFTSQLINTNMFFLVNWHAQVATDRSNFQENSPWSMYSMKPSTNLYSSISLFHISLQWTNSGEVTSSVMRRPFANSDYASKYQKWGMCLVIAEAFQFGYKYVQYLLNKMNKGKLPCWVVTIFTWSPEKCRLTLSE